MANDLFPHLAVTKLKKIQQFTVLNYIFGYLYDFLFIKFYPAQDLYV